MENQDSPTRPEADALYDAYLDACLAGSAEDPASFCARHGVNAPDLRARFDALFAETGRARRREGRPPDSQVAGTCESGGRPQVPFERLGDFRLLRPIDRGGMGAVYLARQESLGRDVALKIIRPELSESPEAAERFRREARSLARLRHPNIVAVHAVGEDRGVQYLAMELVPGTTLDEILAEASARGATVPPSQAIAWVRDLARALDFAHGEGVIHRDVKPSNVVIGPDARPMLLDFGIAKDTQGEGPQLTRTFAGSPMYAAPEQLAGAPADHRADVYGLGVVLYQCFTGRVPFAGGSMEQVLARVLVEEAMPPRRLHPDVPRDAETVVLHALEKDPQRRYPSARHLADDLDAVLAQRPIGIRPPGPLGRVRRWSRRRPVPAAVGATLIVGAVAAATILLVQRHMAEEERRDRAAATVAAAREGLAAYRGVREQAVALEGEAANLRTSLTNRHLSREEDAARDAKEDAAAAARRARETRFFEILDLLRAAELLDATTPGAEDLRAELYRERWLDARAARDAEAASFYRDLVASHDAAGRYAKELRGSRRVAVESDPPGAVVHLFRVRDLADVVPDGEHRLVPAPRDGGRWPIAPGTPALRVVEGRGGVEADDLIVAVAGRPVADAYLVTRGAGDVQRLDRLVAADGAEVRSRSDLNDAAALAGGEHVFAFERGGRTFEVLAASLGAAGITVADAEAVAGEGDVPVTLVHAGTASEVVLARGLVLRRTDAPVVLSEASVAGRTPLAAIELPEGDHLFVLERPGRPRLRMGLRVASGGTGELRVRLPPAGTAPPGFVYAAAAHERDEDLWVMEREVTCAEYLEFLNDPATLARIAASAEPVLFPRTPDNRREGGSWPRDAQGRFSLPAGGRADWPVLGVSWLDAKQYAAWRSARDLPRGTPERYRLPTMDEWVSVASSGADRRFSFGDRFHARWVKSCFARPHASPEPVRSYPVDESVCGVFDLTGSAYEWIDGWWDESRGLRRIAGGSWAQGEVGRFELWGGTGAEPGAAAEEYGLRLVRTVPRGGR